MENDIDAVGTVNNEKINYMDENSTVYTQITKKCKDLGISVSELCRQAKVDRGFLHKLKCGETIAVTNIKLLISSLEAIEQSIYLENMDKKIRNELNIKKVSEMKNPTILMNDKDLKNFITEVETKVNNFTTGSIPTYNGMPIIARDFIELGNLIIYDNYGRK